MYIIEFLSNPDIAKYAIVLSTTGWCILRELTKAKRKGREGERKIRRTIKQLHQDSYYDINDVLIRHTNNQRTSQIDHIIVSSHGVFVLETKNYSGIIFGSEKDTYWTQRIGGRDYNFQNPIHQNSGHIRVLKETLSGYGNIPYISIIVFSNNSTLRINTESTKVIKQKDLINAIHSYREEVIPASLVGEIFRQIQELDINSNREKKKHIKRIKETIKQDHTRERSICPDCGGILIPKTGPFGSFLGCSNYPTCTYTRSIMPNPNNNSSADLHYRCIPEDDIKISA